MSTASPELTVTQGSTTVDILIDNLEHSFDKQLAIIDYPKQTPPKTWIIDLQRLREAITVNGFLLEETGDSAITKKTNLRSIMQTAGIMNVKWDATDPSQWSGGAVGSGSYDGYQVNIMKASIKEIPGPMFDDDVTAESEGRRFDVKMSFVLGDHKG